MWIHEIDIDGREVREDFDVIHQRWPNRFYVATCIQNQRSGVKINASNSGSVDRISVTYSTFFL